MELVNNKYGYKLVLKKKDDDKTIIDVNGIKIGGEKLTFIAGPCSVEAKPQLSKITKNVLDSGANMIRGGTYKLRTSPYTFQGLGKNGLNILNEIRKEFKVPVVSEITSIDNLDEYIKNVDIIQVGARNMFNYELLKELGKVNKPILLKRGMSATIDEFLNAAEYILSNGNKNVILCERGIRTFEDATRNTLDLSAVSILKKVTHLPVIVDPSHATGKASLVKDMSLAAIAAGADGLIIEVSDTPDKALSDAYQAITSEELKEIIIKSVLIKDII